jgi:phosphoribosylcarboxyaminoimidazole (NCAIR) mutase
VKRVAVILGSKSDKERTARGLEVFKSLNKRGKVREIHGLKDRFLMVASDRPSCFDAVLPAQISPKGETQSV